MNDIIKFLSENLLSLLVLFITPILSYLFSRRKEKLEIGKLKKETIKLDIEAEKIEAEKEAIDRENYRKSIEFEQEHSNRLEKELSKKLIELDNRVSLLEDCERERESLKKKIKSISELIDVCERLIKIVMEYNPVEATLALEKLNECKKTLEQESYGS